MTIRYFKDGISNLSDDVEVVAVGAHHYYIVEGRILKAVPEHMVPTYRRDNAYDDPPDILEYIHSLPEDTYDDVDYSLDELFGTVH